MITSATTVADTSAASTPTSSPTVDTSKWEMRDWIQQLHGANRVLSQNPNDQGAQDAVNNAWLYLAQQQNQGAQADIKEAGQLAPPGATVQIPGAPYASLPIGSIAAGIVGFGRGASLGATALPFVTGKEQLGTITAAYPRATLIGDALGTGANMAVTGGALTAAKVPAAYAGATLLGGTGAVRGAFDPILTGDRTFDAILGGLSGVIGGAIVGKIGQKVVAPIWRAITPAIRNTGIKMAAYFGARGMTASEAEEATVSKLRQYLTSLPEASRPSNEAIERQLETVRADFRKAVPVRPLAAGHEAPPAARVVSDELAKPTHLSIPRGEDLRSVQDELERPAFQRTAEKLGTISPSVPTAASSGVGNAPPNPALAEQYVREANERIAAAARPNEPPTNPGSVIRSLEAKKGSPLTAEERDRVLQNLLGKKGSRPNHPIWYGPGSPTITP